MGIALMNTLLLCAYAIATSPTSVGAPSARGRRRTYLSTTEILDAVYNPAFRVESRYESYFKPTMITDESGELAEDVADSVRDRRSLQLPAVSQELFQGASGP